MKNIIKTLIIAAVAILFGSCSSQNTMSPEKVTSLLQGKEFTFMADHANPTNYDVIKVMNSIPGSTSTRILDLDEGYTIVLKKNEMSVELPYFGRLYNPSYDSTKNSFKFTSKDFTINERTGSKNSTIFTIIPKDQINIQRIILEVYKNGRSFVSIDANDRQPITYDGHIGENK